MDISTKRGFGVDIEINRKFDEKRLTCTVAHSGIVTTDKTWYQSPIYGAFSRLYFVTNGSGMIVSDKESMVLQPGYVYLAPCGIPCGFHGTPSVSKLFFHVQVTSSEKTGDLFSEFGHFQCLPYRVKDTETLMSYYRSDDPREQLLLHAEIEATVGRFLLSRGQMRSYSSTVNAVIDYIRSHLCASLTVEEIAGAVFCSRSKLSSIFKNEVGQTVARYIEDLLMNEAQTMLLYSDKTVSEIARALGYCDAFYFSRRFRHRFDISPREYRKQHTL